MFACRILGFMSAQLNIPISKVVQSGTGVAFIAYPGKHFYQRFIELKFMPKPIQFFLVA